MNRLPNLETNGVGMSRALLCAYLAFLSVTFARSTHAFPGAGAECGSCHTFHDGSFEVVPTTLRIAPGEHGEVIFDVAMIPNAADASLGLVGLDAAGLMATPDLTGWNPRPGDAWLTSDLFDSVRSVPLGLTIGDDATLGTYPVVVTLAGGGQWSTTSTFTIEVIPSVEFHRGDCNDDGAVDISDASCLLNWLFLGADTPSCVAATNTNGDPSADISDATYLLNHLFLGGPAPPAPFPGCGTSALETDKALGCEKTSEHCQ